MTAARESLDLATLDPDVAQAHRIHTDENRIWSETNCYVDLWIETLHLLGHDPVPSLAFTLSADHDGQQWTFGKQEQSDLRTLYGVEVTEEALWRPILETVESGPSRGVLFTVEVDSWWLPDTSGSDYRSAHVKTTIVPLAVDRAAQEMTYLHNAGMFRLSGDDFVGVFGLGDVGADVLPPYIEQVRSVPQQARPDRAVDIVRAHLARRPEHNPIDRLAVSVADAVGWLPDAGMETFHRWAFATLRQCGSTAELASDLVVWLADNGVAGAADARDPLLEVASGAKAVQFKMARAARGRAVDVSETLTTMSRSWGHAIDTVAAAVG